MLRRNFRGYLHSLMNEEANKHLVATCLKEAPTKVIGGVRAWEELNGCKLIERFGRKNVHIESLANPPAQADFRKFFEATIPDPSKAKTPTEEASEAARQKWKAELNRVTDDKLKYTLYTPYSQAEIQAESMLFRVFNQDNLWHHVGDVWRSALMPEGQVLKEMDTGEHFMLERAF